MITASSLINETLTLIIDNGKKILTAKSDHPKWKELQDAFKTGNKELLERLILLKTVVEEYTIGKLSVNSAGITYNGRHLHTLDAQRVMAFLKNGLPYQPIANYIDKLRKNPSQRAIEESYKFMEHLGLTLTDAGNVIAFKGVNKDYWSVFGNLDTVVLQGKVDSTGRILNTIGSVIEVERSSVCDDYLTECAPGLHAGSLAYAKGHGDRVVLVEIDPVDFVTVPRDCQFQKHRVCKYKVVGELEEYLPLVYNNENTTVPEISTKDYGTISEELLDKAEQDDTNDDDYCEYCQASIDDCECESGECLVDSIDNSENKLQKILDESNYTVSAPITNVIPKPLLYIENVWTRIKDLFHEQLYGDLGVNPPIKLNDKVNSIGLDSLDGVEICMAIEELFNITISDSDAVKSEENKELTFDQVVSYVIQQIVLQRVPNSDNDKFIDGFVTGANDMLNGNPAHYLEGDVDAADSDNHALYIAGYRAGFTTHLFG